MRNKTKNIENLNTKLKQNNSALSKNIMAKKKKEINEKNKYELIELVEFVRT